MPYIKLYTIILLDYKYYIVNLSFKNNHKYLDLQKVLFSIYKIIYHYFIRLHNNYYIVNLSFKNNHKYLDLQKVLKMILRQIKSIHYIQ